MFTILLMIILLDSNKQCTLLRRLPGWKRKQSSANSSPKQTKPSYLFFHLHIAASASDLLEWYCRISHASTVAAIIVACFRVPNFPFVDCCVSNSSKVELPANTGAMHFIPPQPVPHSITPSLLLCWRVALR